MNRKLLLQIHRWTTLVFALPLLIVIATGLILSIEPLMTRSAVAPGTVTLERVEGILAAQDPAGSAVGIMFSPIDNTAMLLTGERHGHAARSQPIDLTTGKPAAQRVSGFDFFHTARMLHEDLLVPAGGALVLASTIAMLVLVCLGLLMGLPSLRNTVLGWHSGVGWFLVPLLIASPLTGVFMALGVSFTTPPARASGPLPTLSEALRITAASHDLGAVSWIRPRGGQLMVRIADSDPPMVYAVQKSGLVPLPANWPRLLHEGTYGGALGSMINLVIALACSGLLVTGLVLWARRKFRNPKRSNHVVSATRG